MQVVEKDVLPSKSKHELMFAKGVYSAFGSARAQSEIETKIRYVTY